MKKKNEVKDFDLNQMIEDMTDSEMESLLLELSGTRHWAAIIRYNMARRALAEQALFSTDPFKEPTETARNQGLRMGLYDLESVVDLIKEKALEVEKPKKE